MHETTSTKCRQDRIENRKRYLSLIPLKDAVSLIRTAYVRPRNFSVLPLAETAGRVTAEPIFSSYSVPAVPLAAMDGIAVRSTDTLGASNRNPVRLPFARRVNTGNVVPEDCDAVIMIEDVSQEGNSYSIRSPALSGQHIRKPGEDIWEDELILPAGHRILPHDIGALATYGISELSVTSCTVGLIPTGNELVPLGTSPAPGQVVESNSLAAVAWLQTCKVTCTRYPLVPDDPLRLRSAIEKAVSENDLVLVFSGSSVGTKDFTAPVLAELGTVLAHGIAMKPGKPAIIGKIRDKPVIGLPGYPTAAQTALRELAGPLLATWGFPPPKEEELPVILAQSVTSDPGSEDFIRLAVAKVGGQYIGVPLNRSASVQVTGLHANAYMRVPAALEGYETGTEITAYLTRSRDAIDRTLFVVGRSEQPLDCLASILRENGIIITPLQTGNAGAIASLRAGTCHMAAIESPDIEGSFARELIEREFPGMEMLAICLAEIPIGIISLKGIDSSGLEDIRFINRERGSAARAIFDTALARFGIPPENIEGYFREVRHPKAVIDAIRNGSADAGPGPRGLAEKNGLIFTFLAGERYEIVIPSGMLDDPRIKAVLDTAVSPEFRDILLTLDLYDVRNTGELRNLPVSGSGIPQKSGSTLQGAR
ncbi:MAG: substrate-binding domain-containing protein [Methanoregulaceae archaeon]